MSLQKFGMTDKFISVASFVDKEAWPTSVILMFSSVHISKFRLFVIGSLFVITAQAAVAEWERS